jgi:lipooligosaccharide transport system permease protein
MIISAAVAIAEARMGKPGEKYYSGRSRAIMERAYIAFKSSTWMIVISGFVEPVLFLLSFGYGLKNLVGDITVAGQPIGYVAFIAPALLATSAMNGAIYDSTMNVFFKLNHDRIYHGMLATSLGPMAMRPWTTKASPTGSSWAPKSARTWSSPWSTTKKY